MTLREAYRIHRNAARNVGRGKGYTARGLENALPVLEEFWAEKGSCYVTDKMVEDWDNARATVA